MDTGKKKQTRSPLFSAGMHAVYASLLWSIAAIASVVWSVAGISFGLIAAAVAVRGSLRSRPGSKLGFVLLLVLALEVLVSLALPIWSGHTNKTGRPPTHYHYIWNTGHIH